MTPILIILCISLALSALILLNKNKEIKSGKGFFVLGSSQLDARLHSNFEKCLNFVHHFTAETIKQYIQKGILRTENYFIKLFHYISKRFLSFSDILTGHNIPKNRGSASFFLKNIEEHKKTVSGRF